MRIDYYHLDFIDQMLREIMRDVEHRTGLELTITSLYRMGDNGVHGQLPLRGVDLRIRDRTVGEVIEKWINNRWTYDTTRPHLKCAVLHGSTLHLHLQVHKNTRRVDN